MKKSLLLFLLLLFYINLQAQKDTVNISADKYSGSLLSDASNVNLSIFPVPVRGNYVNIKSDKAISSVKITNIIGQDILMCKYDDPQTFIRISLDNTRRGMYLVTVVFIDGLRIVRKIMIEQ
ncbi:MAG: T9SS type A sorting domain-containing protein [Bacteroidales bacterium]|jgi:hypothetical protein